MPRAVPVLCNLAMAMCSSAGGRTCYIERARAGSDELNPLVRGKYRRSRRHPTWPWLYGTINLPRGVVCRLCSYAYALGGFAEEHPDMDALLGAMKTQDCFGVACKPGLHSRTATLCDHFPSLVS